MMQYYSALKIKEILPFATVYMGLDDMTLSKITQLQKDKYHVISLNVESEIVKLIEAENRMVFSRGYGKREIGSCLRHINLQLYSMNKF